jgi:hypothetical protein
VEEDFLQKIIEKTKKKIKDIHFTETNTIIEFDDGEQLVLIGGKNMTGPIKNIPRCSFCNKERTDNEPMISSEYKDNTLICSTCVTKAMELFIGKGIEFNVDLSFFQK